MAKLSNIQLLKQGEEAPLSVTKLVDSAGNFNSNGRIY